MKQLTQNLKDGKMQLMEVPFPALKDSFILVRNHYSVISAGTEGKTVKDARLSYIGKAKTRQKEVKQVVESVKTMGIKQTYDMVMNKLTTPSPLGYSCAGDVIDIGNKVKGFKVGDFAACGGAGANHSEIVSVPVNLCVKVPKEVDLKYAAFTTVSSIAMQGIRQADLRLGENCVVIGLGLIGQITMQLLNSGGIFPIGIDIDNNQVELANKVNTGKSFLRNIENIEEVVLELTNGYGTDAVIITAGTSSNDPVKLAGSICRKKGKVVIVGAVPTGFERTNYYKKELELKMSSSYGPGRYDPSYEEKGLDYPIGYVRWTENRNMQSFVHLLAQNKLNLDPLITHQFKFEEAPEAYDLILNKTEPYTGIIFKYNITNKLNQQYQFINPKSSIQNLQSTIKIGFIGAGSFAQNFLLPNITRLLKQQPRQEGKAALIGVATARSNTARHIADKYGFVYATCNANEIIKDENINTVFIATRHNLHSEYVIKSLESGKNVFVEKPLAMNIEELEKISTIYHASMQSYNHSLTLMVGFNRRFSPLIQKIKELMNDELPKAINYRINAGNINADHWVQDPEIGGGRIIGEVCHFIDLATYISGSEVSSVTTQVLDNSLNLHDTLSIILKFKNGSIATLSYFSNGNKLLSKEYLEVFHGSQVFVVDDFKVLNVYSNKKSKIKIKKQDKGHTEEIKSYIHSIIHSLPCPISFKEIYNSTLITFKVIESINSGQTIYI